MTPLRWGVLSTAAIGSLVIRATRGSGRARFVAVASRDHARARAFADEHDLEHAYGSYEELLASSEVDAVYVALPVSLHTQWTVRALQAGKHVLCEKPFATTAADAARAFDAADAAGRQCVEGLMWRLHPQTGLAQVLVAQGAIGELRLVRAALSVSVPPGDIRRDAALGGGAYLDLGCYCVSAIRLFGGEPENVYAEAVLDGAGVDLRLAATLRLPGGAIGQFDVGLEHDRRDELELVGSTGTLVVPDPWIGRSRSLVLRRDGRVEQVPVPEAERLELGEAEEAVYRLELERVSSAILAGERQPFGRDDAVAQARVLEALRASAVARAPVAVTG